MALLTSIMRGGTNNHETTSEEANAYATDFVGEGIVDAVANTSGVAPMTGGFSVNAQGSPNMTVAVGTGIAYVEGTPTSQNAQTFRVKNTSSTNVTISANSSGSTKYDWLYIKLDADLLNNPTLVGDTTATLVTSRSTNASTDDGSPPTYGYPIAVVTVANGAATITNASIRDLRSRVALETGVSSATDGWLSISNSVLSVASGYNAGGKSYTMDTSTDLSSILSAGMRLKISRNTTPPTQCADLESGSSQYANRASASVSGITFTDDFSAEAWIKLESYGAIQTILSRYSTQGFFFGLTANGTIRIQGTSGANSDLADSIPQVPLNQWVHIAATIDMSAATATIYINGVSVSLSYTNGAGTALTQAGDLQIGAYNGATSPLDAKVSDVRLWNAVRTATQIRDNMNQQLAGNETNLVGYWKLNGNFNDSTSNANNLTAQGGAAATNSDNPMNSTEYALISRVTSSTIVVHTGENHNIPNMTLNSPSYSVAENPFGWPGIEWAWNISTIATQTITAGAGNTALSGLTLSFVAPDNRRLEISLYIPGISAGGGALGSAAVWSGTVGSGVNLGGTPSQKWQDSGDVNTLNISDIIFRPSANSVTLNSSMTATTNNLQVNPTANYPVRLGVKVID